MHKLIFVINTDGHTIINYTEKQNDFSPSQPLQWSLSPISGVADGTTKPLIPFMPQFPKVKTVPNKGSYIVVPVNPSTLEIHAWDLSGNADITVIDSVLIEYDQS